MQREQTLMTDKFPTGFCNISNKPVFPRRTWYQQASSFSRRNLCPRRSNSHKANHLALLVHPHYSTVPPLKSTPRGTDPGHGGGGASCAYTRGRWRNLNTSSLTISNNRRTNFSDSPLYLDVSVEEDTLKKVVPHSVATALANIVLPVPGGPTISTPWNYKRGTKWNIKDFNRISSIIKMYMKIFSSKPIVTKSWCILQEYKKWRVVSRNISIRGSETS